MRGPLVIASHNPGKVKEFGELLAPLHIEVLSAGELDLSEPEETGSSFAENAELKARSAASESGKAALADDSGFCVPALNDAPGIYSARWAGKTKDFASAWERIRKELQEKGVAPDGAPAYFICVLAFATPDGRVETFEGRADGVLTLPPRGNRGFGYDPVFTAEGRQQTFGEMEPSAKHAISHRAKAFEKFTRYLKTQGKNTEAGRGL